MMDQSQLKRNFTRVTASCGFSHFPKSEMGRVSNASPVRQILARRLRVDLRAVGLVAMILAFSPILSAAEPTPVSAANALAAEFEDVTPIDLATALSLVNVQ